MKNSAIGSTFIVAGTALGAGMLAMPIATVSSGFGVAFLMLVGLWLVMSYTALLLVEAYQYSQPDIGLSNLAKTYLGAPGQWLASFAMPFLMYSLVAAYLSGGGDIITASLNEWFDLNLPKAIGVLAFATIGGTIVCVGTRSVDLVNRCLFAAKIVFLVGLLFFLLPHVKSINLETMPVGHAFVLAAIPIVFTSFGFHGSVPSLVSYMQGDTKKLRIIFIVGSAIPLVVYILWLLATLGTIHSQTLIGILQNTQVSALENLLSAMKAVLKTEVVEVIVATFAALALVTSFLGVALGLFDFLAGFFKRKDTAKGRLQTGLITFLPPLPFALFFREGFVFALGFAAIALAILALILPALLVYKTRQTHEGGYRVMGGNLGLAFVFLLGIAIIIIQVLVVTGMLPNLDR
ncbi:tyrosine transporter TyrP [Pseudomonas sp. F1_0610]|uniref:tyrosine transporter TyrP n=1 Tax=Pseudomonas sp. F1_0610 TaxID=3114284 RepID=UPI0039C06E6A